MIISKRISESLINNLTEKNLLPIEQKEAYIFCVDFTLDLILFNSGLLLIGLIIGQFIPSLVYILSIVPLKMLAGGAHSKTPCSCTIISCSVFLMTLFIAEKYPFRTIFSLLFSFVFLVLIIYKTPVEHKNKKYLPKQRKTIRKMILFDSIFLLFFQSAMILLDLYTPSTIVLLSIFITLINQYIGLMIQKGNKK